MSMFLYRGFALHVRLDYPAGVFVHPSWDTDRKYLLTKASSMNEAQAWCDQTLIKAEAHIRKAEERKEARVKEEARR